MSIGKGTATDGKLSIGEMGAPGARAEGARQPPDTDRGVEFCPHWLTLTVWASPGKASDYVGRLLGFPDGVAIQWEYLKHGARSFRQLAIGPGGCKLYSDPASEGGYCSLEFPGELIAAIPPDRLQSLIRELRAEGVRYQVTRFDLAWDHAYYEPAQVHAAVVAGDVRSLAKRDTLREIKEHFKGGHTVYLGSRQSERMLRVYLKDGRTRTEIELKGERAQAVFDDLIDTAAEGWVTRALAHLRDYCDFKADWWGNFCNGVERAYFKLARWAETSFERTRAWLEKQVAPALALFEEIAGFKALIGLLEDGHGRFRQRHRLILTACGVEG